jgi:hypothetical protein
VRDLFLCSRAIQTGCQVVGNATSPAVTEIGRQLRPDFVLPPIADYRISEAGFRELELDQAMNDRETVGVG